VAANIISSAHIYLASDNWPRYWYSDTACLSACYNLSKRLNIIITNF